MLSAADLTFLAAYCCSEHDAMLSIVAPANVACGFHAGDPEITVRIFKPAKDR